MGVLLGAGRDESPGAAPRARVYGGLAEGTAKLHFALVEEGTDRWGEVQLRGPSCCVISLVAFAPTGELHIPALRVPVDSGLRVQGPRRGVRLRVLQECAGSLAVWCGGG